MGKPSSQYRQDESIAIGDGASEPAQLTRRQVVGSALLAPAVLGAWAAAPAGVEDAERSYLQPQPEADWHAYLTVAERAHPLAKYWYRFTPVADDVVSALEAGPIDPADMLPWEARTRLADPSPPGAANGWCVLPDGSQYVAVRTRFSGCTADMLDWWFIWAQRDEIIRYKIWYPGAHVSMSENPTPDFERRPDDKPYWGLSRFPVEDVGMGVARLRLDFVRPEAFGFGPIRDGDSAVCVRVGLPDGLLKHTDMIHYVYADDDGFELRSRFWMGRDFEAMAGGWPIVAALADNAVMKRKLLPQHAAQGLAWHCATEYHHLASFLAELYADYGQQ
jgi:hypothetical protein